jgi:hypothetical protein
LRSDDRFSFFSIVEVFGFYFMVLLMQFLWEKEINKQRKLKAKSNGWREKYIQ